MRFDPTYSLHGKAGMSGGCKPVAASANRHVEPGWFRQRAKRAFTLLELLVVMGIIAILATIGLPSLSGLGGTLDIDSAHRQLLDDLSYARLKAISERTRVYVVFVPPGIVDAQWAGLSEPEKKELQELLGLQYRGYALFTERSLGDQPGRGKPRYLTEWRALPEGVFITPFKFQRTLSETERLSFPLTNRPFAYYPVPFPMAQSTPPDNPQPPDFSKYLPCVVFDYRGQLVGPGDAIATDVYIPLTKGSIIYPTDDQDRYELSPAEVIETPLSNHWSNPAIQVDWLTGRTRSILPGGTKG